MTVENDAMADTATPELSPCPFCGAAGSYVLFCHFGAECAICHARGPRAPMTWMPGAKDYSKAAKKRAAKAWNRRATLEGR